MSKSDGTSFINKVFNIDLMKRSREDTSSFCVTGECLPDEDVEAITINHGYSKDHRPDFKQVVLEMMTSQDGGIPILMKCWDGNSDD